MPSVDEPSRRLHSQAIRKAEFGVRTCDVDGSANGQIRGRTDPGDPALALGQRLKPRELALGSGIKWPARLIISINGHAATLLPWDYDHDLEASAVLDAPHSLSCVRRVHQPFCAGCISRGTWGLEDDACSSDAPDPDLSHPHRAGDLMALGVGRSGPVYRVGTPLPRHVLGPASLVRIRGDFGSVVPARRALPGQLDLESGTTLQDLNRQRRVFLMVVTAMLWPGRAQTKRTAAPKVDWETGTLDGTGD